MTETPETPTQDRVDQNAPPDSEPTDDQLRSDEARRYRQRLRESEDTNATLLREAVAREERLQAVERQFVTEHIRAKVNDPEYFWDKTDLASLRGEDGIVDLAKAETAADELVRDHPSLRPPSPDVPLAAIAGAVSGSGKIGYPPSSVMDGDTVLPVESRDWATFLTDAARGAPPQQ